MNKLSVSDALNLAVGLANFTAAMWGLYCTTVVGLFAWVATLAGTDIVLPVIMKFVISVVWTAVTILNALSIYKHNEEVNSLLNYIAKHSGELSDTIRSIKVTHRAMLLHFVGWLTVTLFLWTYNLLGGSVQH